jgi:beta-ureidopropionase / N-carbamoyl-L-amino-acid hydrolase
VDVIASSLRVAEQVSGERLDAALRHLAGFGARSDGGVARLALGAEHVAARRWLIGEASALGADARMDAAGNLFLTLPGSDPTLAPVVTGSHVDSQPTGGRYDGALGVLSGLEVLRAVREAGVQPRRALTLVDWSNEEGVRFAPGTMGSAVYCGVRGLDETRAVRDPDGIDYGSAVDACRDALGDLLGAPYPLGAPLHAFIELHIEQGPVLEAAGAAIGVVNGIQGVRWFEIGVHGRSSHAGTTPRAARRDAVEAACALAVALRAETIDEADVTRFTIGRFLVSPGAVNTIAEEVRFTVDLRHPDAGTLAAIGARLERLCARTWAGCTVRLTELSASAPAVFPAAMTALLDQAAGELGMHAPRLVSGAFHDALHVARHCDTGMVFVRSNEGLSHHPAEFTALDDAVAGTRLLAAGLTRLCLR